ncbi:AraC family transcriptional regulator [Pseudomonas sp. PB3P13]
MSIYSKKAESLTPIHTTARVVRYLMTRGVALDALLAHSGLVAKDIDLPSRMLNLWQEQTVLNNALKEADTPVLGIEIGLEVRLSAVGLLGYAMLTAPTLGEGLEVPLRLPALLGTYFDIRLEHDEGTAYLIIENCRAPESLEHCLSEICLSAFKSMMEDMLYEEIKLSTVHLAYSASDEVKEAYRVGFGTDVAFEQQQTKMSFPAVLLSRKLRLSDTLCHENVLEHCYSQNRELAANREWLERLRGLISTNLLHPPSLNELGHMMHCSPRTLRRQMQLQNTSYRALLDELRFLKAKELLRNSDMNIESIAENLGFSDGAGLRRAFRRWSGHSPKIFRG